MLLEVCATSEKFLEPSGFCTVIHCTSTFSTRNDFDYFHGFMIQFECVKPNFLELDYQPLWNNFDQFGHMIYMLQTSKIL